jgi:hydroxyacyl-ACP dehydratase HTD2-like protein with hotdog domain
VTEPAVAFDEVYENTRKLIGAVVPRTLGRIDERELERFAVTIGAEREQTADGTIVAHPLYLTAVLGWGGGPDNDDLRPDGTELLDIDAIPLAGLRLMGGGQNLEFHHRVTAGMTVRSEFSLEGVELKDGRSGRLMLLHIKREYWDGDDRLLVTCRETLMAR